MNDLNERAIRSQVNRYRAWRIYGMLRAVILIVVGAILFFWSVSGKFASDSGTIGPQGVMLLGLGIGALLTVMGIIWFVRLRRDLREGAKAFEQTLRSGVRII